MEYTSKQKEHLIHCFDSFCKTAIHHCAMNLYRERDRQIKRIILHLMKFTQSIQSNAANAVYTRFCNISL